MTVPELFRFIVDNTFRHVVKHDVVMRNFAGQIQQLLVDEVDVFDDVIRASCATSSEIFTFDRESGWEIDASLEWGPEFGKTGSFLVHPYVHC